MEPVRILVVDDNDAVRSIMKIILSVEPDVGDVREAGDGTAALEVCGDFAPDVVLLDYWMPKMDGGAAATRIRAMHPSTRIVAYSAVLREKPEWADGYVAKDAIPDPRYLVELARSPAAG